LNYINLTPHTIVLNDGREFQPSGIIARVSVQFGPIVNDVSVQSYGNVVDLPEPKDDTCYIVSGIVLAACGGRVDVVAPATGHKDCVRNEKGHIVSVPCFTR